MPYLLDQQMVYSCKSSGTYGAEGIWDYVNNVWAISYWLFKIGMIPIKYWLLLMLNHWHLTSLLMLFLYSILNKLISQQLLSNLVQKMAREVCSLCTIFHNMSSISPGLLLPLPNFWQNPLSPGERMHLCILVLTHVFPLLFSSSC